MLDDPFEKTDNQCYSYIFTDNEIIGVVSQEDFIEKKDNILDFYLIMFTDQNPKGIPLFFDIKIVNNINKKDFFVLYKDCYVTEYSKVMLCDDITIMCDAVIHYNGKINREGK